MNDATELLMSVNAIAPDGARSTGSIRLNRLTNQATTTGLNDVARVLSASRDVRLLRAALPGITHQMSAKSGRFTPVVNAGADCTLFVIGVFIAVDAAVAACGIPEPVEPYACSAAVAAVGAAAGAMANAGCTNNVDNTIGWG